VARLTIGIFISRSGSHKRGGGLGTFDIVHWRCGPGKSHKAVLDIEGYVFVGSILAALSR
jgi:hypothetical protein